MVDTITTEVKRVKEKYLVPTLPLKIQADDPGFMASEMADLSKIASNIQSFNVYNWIQRYWGYRFLPTHQA
jgi:hypothetical protein